MDLVRAAEDICDALGGKRVGTGWKARCPAHDDRTPSLQITVRDDKLLVHCFGGCDQEAVIAALRDRNLWPEPEQPIRPPVHAHRPAPPAPASGQPTARFVYRDLAGEPVAYKERYDTIDASGKPAKRCVWYGADGTSSLGSAKPGLYRQEILPTLPADAPILFVEGEKCVRVAEGLGFAAVCGPHGSNSKLNPEAAQLLRGRAVILLPDHDEPGQKHMRQMERALQTAGARPLRLDLPGLGDHEDIADWVARGGTKEQLDRLIVAARDSTKPQPILVLLRDVQREPVSFLWRPYIPLKKLTIVDGDPGARKSWLVCAVAMAVSRGRLLPGDPRETSGPQNVLILAGEDGLEETVRPRLEDMGADLDRVTAMVAVMKEDREQVLMFDPDGLAALERAIQQIQPALVIVDPLVAYLGGSMDMGKSNEVRALLRPLGDMAQRHGLALVATRHLTKAQSGSALYRGQGSIDFNATARSVLGVAIDPGNPEQSIMAHIKASLVRKGPSIAYSLVDGANGTSVAWGGVLPITAEELFGGGDAAPMTSIDEAKAFLTELLFEGPVPSREVSNAAKDFGLSDITLRRAKDELGIIWKRQGGVGRGRGEVVLELPLMAETYTPVPAAVNVPLTCSSESMSKLMGDEEGLKNGENKPKSETAPPPPPLTCSSTGDEQVNENPPSDPLTNDPENPDGMVF